MSAYVRIVCRAVLAVAALTCAFARAQRTIHVPADAATIQQAINTSSNGDTILVAPGTYYENIDFNGHNVTLISANGPATTILDGSQLASTVQFVSGETRAAQIAGFTIRNGQPPNYAPRGGGGIYVSIARPTITNNIVTGNYCMGIAVQQGGPLIQGNTVTMTHGADRCEFPGTAINLYDPWGGTPAIVQNNILTGNVEETFGALLVNGSEDCLIQNNIIRDNKAIGSGSCAAGACFFNTSAATFAGNEFLNNQSAGSSGAQSFFAGILELAGNNSGAYQLRVVNNTFFNQLPGANYTPEVLLSGVNSRTLFINNVIESNGSGVSCTSSGNPSDGPPDVEHNGSSTPQLAYSAACGPNVSSGHANNPAMLIQDAQGNYVPNGKLGGGNNSVLPQPATDLEGNPRFTIPSIDVGALESGGATIPQTKIVIAPSRFDVGTNQQLTVQAAIINTGPADTAGTTLDLNLDGTVVQQVSIASPGTARFPPVTVTPGTHEIYASTHSGTPTIPASDSVRTIVHGNSSTLSSAGGVLSLASSTGSGFVTLTMSMTGNTAPEYGTLRLFDNGILIQSSSYNTATTSQYRLTPTTGTHLIEADYQGRFASSAVLAFGTDSTYQLYSQPNPAAFGSPVTIGGNSTPPPTALSLRIVEGSTVLLDQPLDSSGSASLTRSDLSPGTHTFTGTFYDASGVRYTGTLTENIGQAPTSTTLTATPSSTVAGAPVTLTVTTASPYTGAPITGSISIFSGGTLLTTVNATNGTATFTTTSLPLGISSLSASYAGSSTFQPSSSGSITVVITIPPDFTISPTAPALSLRTQHHGDIVLTLTPLNGFTGNVSVVCGNLPPVATCTPDAPQYVVSGQTTASVSLHVETSTIPGFMSSAWSPAFGRLPGVLLGTLSLPFCLLRRSRAGRLCGFVTLTLLLCMLGCSGKSPASTPPGSYTLYVTAAGSSNGTTVSHSVPVQLTVTR